MTSGPDAGLDRSEASGAGPNEPTGRARPPRHELIWPHLAGFALVLLAVAALGPSQTPWVSDDGAYAIAARQLVDEGRWDVPYWFGGTDPAGEHFGLENSEHIGGRWYPYVKQPMWVIVLAGAYATFGTAGLVLPSILCALAAAAAAWCLAGALDRRWRIAGFWIAACGPLLVHGGGLWAHAAAAAAGGWAVVAAVRCVRSDGAPVMAGLALAAALAALIAVRSEGLLFAASLLTVLTATLAGRRAGRSRSLWTLGPAAVSSAVTVVGSAVLRRSIAPGATTTLVVRGGGEHVAWLPGRFSGAWASLLDGGQFVGTTRMALAATVLLVVTACVTRSRAAPLAPTLLAVAAGLVVIGYLRGPFEFVDGFLPAWPVAIIGVGLWRWSAASLVERVMAVTVAAFVVAVVLTQYPGGGGAEWGGRFLAAVIVPVAALAAAGGGRMVDRTAGGPADGMARRLVVGSTAALMVVPAIHGVTATENARHYQDGLVRTIEAADGPVVVSTWPGMGRLSWFTQPAAQSRMLSSRREDVRPLLDDLAGAGHTEITLVGTDVGELVPDGWTVERATEGWLVVIRFEG